MRQKLEHAKEITEEAKGTLKAFTAQSAQVEKFISDIATWLTKLEDSLMNCAQTETCEGLRKVKVSHKLSRRAYTSAVTFILLFYSDFHPNITSVLHYPY